MPSSSLTLVAAVLAIVGCSPEPNAAPPTVTVAPPPAAPSPTATPIDTEAKKPERCPIVPMKLVTTEDERQLAFVSLDADGSVRGPEALGDAKVLAKLDTRGCLYLEDGSHVIELTSENLLWTQRGSHQADGRRVSKLLIGEDGTVAREGQPPSMRLVGFEERGLCAGKLLVMVMYAIVNGTSMAVAEGVAKTQPPPADSVCPDRHAASASGEAK